MYHARSSARKWGGVPEDYLALHEWMDASAAHVNDFRHRAMRHHSFGIAEGVERFGRMLTISTGREVSVKKLLEQHCLEDIGFIPTVADWVRGIKPDRWMRSKAKRTVTF